MIKDVKSVKKIIFDGAYGIQSFGDDAAFLVLAEKLRERLGDTELVVVSRHPEDINYAVYGARSIGGIEYLKKEDSIGRWFRGFNPGDDETHLNNLYHEIKSSHLLVLGAGNFLVDYSIGLLKGPISRFVVMSLIARMCDVPVFWYGISVGPFFTDRGREFSKLAASLASLISVRDPKSFTQLREIGVENDVAVLPDVVYGLSCGGQPINASSEAYRLAHSSGFPVLTVSVRAFSSPSLSHEEYLDLIRKFCDDAIQLLNCVVLFVPQCTYEHGEAKEDDRFVAEQVIMNLKNNSRAYSAVDVDTVEQCYALYANSFATLGTRLHACVFSVLNGIPTVGLNYNPKVKEFFSFINIDELCLDLENIDTGHIMKTLLKAIEKRSTFKEKSEYLRSVGLKAVEKYTDMAISAMK